MEKKIFSLKRIFLIVVIFTLLFVQVSSEPINSKANKKNVSINGKVTAAPKGINRNTVRNQPASKKPAKTFTPKKYRKNFVIRIPKTIFKPDGPKRITITKTTPPATVNYEVPTHTADDLTTTYYSTFAFDFISPSPQLSRIFRTKKSPITKVFNNKIPITKAPNNKVPVTKASNSQATTPVTEVTSQTKTVPVTKAP